MNGFAPHASRLRFFAWCRLAGWLGIGWALRATAAPALFEVVPSEASRLGTSSAGGERSGRWRLAQGLDPASWRPGDRWTVPSGATTSSGSGAGTAWIVDDVRGSEFDPASRMRRVRAHPEGEPGAEILLVLDDTTAVATWRSSSGEMTRVLPDGRGLHGWTRLAAERGPDCANAPGPGLRLPPAPARRPAGLPGPDAGEVGEVAGSAGPAVPDVLDIAFFHTPAAQVGAGGARGIVALLELAVWEANDAYERSGALLRLRPVAYRRVAYPESGDLVSDLSRFAGRNDGHLDEIHRIRDEVAADVVCLVTEWEASNRFAGMANALQSLDQESITQGFLVCLRPYLVGNYTLPHEVGHVLGCAHDRENAGVGGLQAWSYGTRILVDGQQYRTIMAYRPGLQFPHFSNPRVSYRGVPTGAAGGPDEADNVRTLRLTAPLVSQSRTPGNRMGFESNLVHVPEAIGIARLPLVREGGVAESSCRVTAIDGSAVNGRDFAILWEMVRFASNQVRQVASVEIRDNGIADGSRRFTLLLENPSPGGALGPNATLDVIIDDDESDAAAALDTSFRPVPGADLGVGALGGGVFGSIYAGGAFMTVNGSRHARFARLTKDGAADPTFAPNVKYQVNALAVLPNQRIVIGGEFNTVNGVRMNHVAVLTTAGELSPDFEFETGTDYPVHAILSLPDGRFVVGGGFTTIQGVSAFRVARLRSTGEPDPAFSRQAGPDGDVRALQRDAIGRLYVGGKFGAFGGRPRPGIGRLGPDGTVDLAFGAEGTADGAVLALLVDDVGRIWVGGEFKRFLGAEAGGLACLTTEGRWDGTFPAGPGANDAVLALAPAGEGRVWIAGRFTSVQGQRRHRVARLLADGRLDPAFDPGLGPNDAVLAVLPGARGGIVLGGLFTEVNGIPRGGLAALLPSVPPRSWFQPLARVGTRVTWSATVAAGQTYSLETSGDLRGWSEVGTWASPDGVVVGATETGAGGAGFFRLRRRLE